MINIKVKTQHYAIASMVVTLFSTLLFSCSSDRHYDKKIIGTWFVDSSHIRAVRMRDSLSRPDGSMQQRWTFKDNGTFSVATNSYSNSGGYSMSNIDTNYFLYMDNGNNDPKTRSSFVTQIVYLSDKSMALLTDRGNAKITMYLTKH